MTARIQTIVVALLSPAAHAADVGTITGVIDRPNDVTALVAVDRSDDKKDGIGKNGIGDLKKGYPGRVDANTGRFTIQGLAIGKAYDIIVEAGPVQLEGVNLHVPRSEYEEEQPLSDADKKKIEKIARSLNKFEDQIEVMAITGNIQHAAVLLNKQRTTPFYNSKPGEIIWRLELWKFERPEEQWVKVQDELFLTYYRVRLQKSDYDKKMLTLDPALGGVKLTEKAPSADIGKIALPDKKTGVRLRKENIKEVVATEK